MFDSFVQFVLGLDPISIAIGVVGSGLVSLWLDFFVKQPRLRITGGGSGRRGDGWRECSANLRNQVGWFGILIPETKIVGLRVHPRLRWGTTFERRPARDCRALLFLKETGEHVGSLWWRLPDGSVSDVVTIDSGDSASLILFARTENEGEEYFPFQPTDRETGIPELPDEKARFTGSNKFDLHITYSHGKRLKEEIRMTRKYNGLLYIERSGGSSLF